MVDYVVVVFELSALFLPKNTYKVYIGNIIVASSFLIPFFKELTVHSPPMLCYSTSNRSYFSPLLLLLWLLVHFQFVGFVLAKLCLLFAG